MEKRDVNKDKSVSSMELIEIDGKKVLSVDVTNEKDMEIIKHILNNESELTPIEK